MKRILLASLLIAGAGPAIPVPALAQEGEPGRVTHEAAGDSEKAEGPGTEHHPAGEPKMEPAGPAPAGEAEEAEDPTEHFNFANVHYHGKDEYGGAFGDGEMVDPNSGHKTREEEPMSAPFVLALVNFGILLLLLGKFLWPVGKKLARDRHDQIKSALDEAAKLREQAAQKLAQYEARIKGVDAEVQKLVDGIRADAEADKQRILATAQAQAAQMKRDAEQRIAAEIETARAALTREVTAAATAATEKLLKDKVTPDDQRKLVATFISNVERPSQERPR